MIALLFAASLAPQIAEQIRATLPPGPPARIEALAESGELLLFCLVTKTRSQVEAARVKDAKLQGDPDDVGGPLKRESCGKAELGAPFEVKRGKKRQRAVVAHLEDAGLSAVISLSGKVLAWTDAPAPDGGPAIFPESGKGDTTFCAFLPRTLAWTRVAWVEEVDGYAPVQDGCRRR
ncbi:MAG: hypothetical protein ACJ79H_09960 [Myxococcales bacterium]